MFRKIMMVAVAGLVLLGGAGAADAQTQKDTARTQVAQQMRKGLSAEERKSEMMAKRKDMIRERLAKLDDRQLTKRKETLEKRLSTETDERRKEFTQMELDVVNELIK